MLCMGCARLASASEVNVRRVGARASTSCGCLFPPSPVWLKTAMVYSILTISLCDYILTVPVPWCFSSGYAVNVSL